MKHTVYAALALAGPLSATPSGLNNIPTADVTPMGASYSAATSSGSMTKTRGRAASVSCTPFTRTSSLESWASQPLSHGAADFVVKLNFVFDFNDGAPPAPVSGKTVRSVK
jgi:hypothetical protein